MGTLKEVCFFFNSSPKRQRCLEETIRNEAPTSKQTKLVDLFKTRWIERHLKAFETFSKYEVILACLESITETIRSWDSETLIKARGFIACLTSFGFLATFIVTKNCLRYLKPVSVSIQQRSKDIILDVQRNWKRQRMPSRHAEWYGSILRRYVWRVHVCCQQDRHRAQSSSSVQKANDES